MERLKVFTTGNAGFIGSAVRDALGLPTHVRQARVLIVAPNKAAAWEMAEAWRSDAAHVAVPARSDPEFRQAVGDDVDALRAAGLLGEPAILVLRMLGPGPVVALDPAGDIRRVGSIRYAAGSAQFEPEG